MRILRTIGLLAMLLTVTPSLQADQDEIGVSKIDVSALQWGRQTAVFKLSSKVNYVKYVTVELDVRFSESVLNPSKQTRTTFLLKPLESVTCTTGFSVPTNYGRADVEFSFYDVVDTLDFLMPGQVFHTQSFSATFEVPEQVRPYFTKKIPRLKRSTPTVGKRPPLDNELACVVLILSDEGKTIKEVSDMTGVDAKLIYKIRQDLIDNEFVSRNEREYQATVPTPLTDTPTPEIQVGEVDFSSLRWGKQTATFEMTNNTDYIKFVTAEMEVQFAGSYLNPNRRTRTHYILRPYESRPCSSPVYIPGNYGQAQISVSLYDVIDTLDALVPSRRFLYQPFTINFRTPDEMLPYFSEKVTMPPRVEEHPDFDNEFARMLLLLLNEGKTPEEIAAVAAADTSYVNSVIQSMTQKGYLTPIKNTFKVSFPVITVSEAEEARKVAVRLADTLTGIVKANMGNYRMVLDSLVAAGAVDQDSNTFFNGGTVLYHPYPVVSALLLWYELGREFITRSAPLLIYDGTDVCNAYIPQYMYAVQGGDLFNGTHFFDLSQNNYSYIILYGDVIPDIDCPEDYVLRGHYFRQNIEWHYAEDYQPESFMLDTSVVKPALNALAKGADTLLTAAYYKLRDIAVKFGHQKLQYGERYWFWNLVATQTLEKLVEMNVVSRRGKGQFRFEGLPQ